MDIDEIKAGMEANWKGVVRELIDENLDTLLENLGMEDEEIEKYKSFEDLPEDIASKVWDMQDEHLGNEFDSYAEWYFERENAS